MSSSSYWETLFLTKMYNILKDALYIITPIIQPTMVDNTNNVLCSF